MNKKSLGSLFGAKIVSISYNFSISNEPSSCTITVLNEHQVYQYPEFDQVVSIPPFNILMKVVEYTVIHNDYKYLQVELVENLYSILDKNLVLVYGDHTDQQSKINSDLSWIFKSGFIDKQYWDFPNKNIDKNYIVPKYPDSLSFGNGIHILGLARAFFTKIPEVKISEGLIEPEASSFILDKGALREEISFVSNNETFKYTGQDIGIEYGYYLKDLKNLLIKLGIKFNAANRLLLDNDTVLFNDSGTLREVLSAVLAKIGMSFYVNPFTQEVHLVTNADLARINANIFNYHVSFSEECATQKTFTRSIKGVDATHVIIKGDLNKKSSDARDEFEKGESKLRTDKLYRVEAPNITGLTSKEFLTIYRFLPLVLLGVEDEVIESYIYMSAIKDGGTNDWGDLVYGGDKDLMVNPQEYWSKNLNKDFDSLSDFEQEVVNLKNNLPANRLGNYFSGEIATIKNLYSDGGVDSDGKSIDNEPRSPKDFVSYIKDFAKMWGGIYISPPMTKREALSRDYKKQEYNTGNAIEWFYASADTPIGELGPLTFLTNLLSKRSERYTGTATRMSVTVGELARASGAIRRTESTISEDTADFLGEDYHIIALHSIPIGKGYDNLPIALNRFIGSNISYFQYDGGLTGSKSTSYLAGTKEANSMYQSLKKNLEKILDETLSINRNLVGGIDRSTGKSFPKNIIVKYEKTQEDNGKSFDQEDPPIFDEGSPMFIKHIEYNGNVFYKRSILQLQMGMSETDHFLNHFGSLNPATPTPFVSSSISYGRPPLITDFDIDKGLSSLTVSIGADGGITTEATYSSRQFINVDVLTHRNYLGVNNFNSRSSIVTRKPNYRNAFGIING